MKHVPSLCICLSFLVVFLFSSFSRLVCRPKHNKCLALVLGDISIWLKPLITINPWSHHALLVALLIKRMKELRQYLTQVSTKAIIRKNTSQIVQNSYWFVVLKHYILWKLYWRQRGMFHCGLFKYYSSLSFSLLLHSVHPLSLHPTVPSSLHFVFDFTVHPSSTLYPLFPFTI